MKYERLSKVRQRAGLAHVFQRVAFEGFHVVFVGPLDTLAFEVGALGGVGLAVGGVGCARAFHAATADDAEMPRGVLQPEALQFARADVVELEQQERVDDVPPAHLELGIIDRLLRDLYTRGSGGQQRAVAPPRELDLVPLRAGGEVGQVELEEVVPLEHVRVAFLDDGVEAFERVLLAFDRHGPVDHDDLLPARVVAHGDGHEVVAGPLGVGELVALRAIRLDVDLHAAQFGEIHPLEQRPARGGQVLLDGIVEREIAHAGAVAQGDVLERLEVPPARATHEPVEQVNPPARGSLSMPSCSPGQPQERLETGALDLRRFAARRPAVDLDLVLTGEFHRDDARGRIGAEQRGIFLKIHGRGSRPPKMARNWLFCHCWEGKIGTREHSTKPAASCRFPAHRKSHSRPRLYANPLAFLPLAAGPFRTPSAAAFGHRLPVGGDPPGIGGLVCRPPVGRGGRPVACEIGPG